MQQLENTVIKKILGKKKSKINWKFGKFHNKELSDLRRSHINVSLLKCKRLR